MEVTYKVLVGDCIEQMRTLPDESVHMIATSPPYWGLRDYGCDGQIGLESTPEEFVARLVDVFREARRVLRDDGVCWVNLGDSYCSTDKWGGGGDAGKHVINWTNADNGCEHIAQRDECSSLASECVRCVKCNGSGRVESWQVRNRKQPITGVKPKDLVGIPWRVAFALQADGWWLRQDVIWSKPNPMPESVTDRCTKAHEYVFLLAKSARYFYDAEAIKTPLAAKTLTVSTTPMKGTGVESTGEKLNAWMKANGGRYHPAASNRRSVWTIAKAPYKEAHFATWPPKLVEPMIRAGTSERGCCAACGAQWVRTIESEKTFQTGSGRSGNAICGKQDLSARRTNSTPDIRRGPVVSTKTTGWKPSCQCSAGEPGPCTVLDPFGGSGTTLGVANALGRNGIACELNPEYAALMPARVRSIVDAYYGRESAPSIEPGEGQLSLFKK